MDINILTQYFDIITVGICLCVGYVIKTSLDFVPNKYIPLIMLILGTILGVVSNGLTLASVLSGMVSGLASTGLYEAFRNLINRGDKDEKLDIPKL